MSLLRKKTNTFVVKDEFGKNDYVYEYSHLIAKNIKVTVISNQEFSSTPNLKEYELSDGTPLFKFRSEEFQTIEQTNLRRYFIV